MSIVELSDADFEGQVLHASQPVLVEFGAEWCHPCRQLEPIIDELADEWGEQVKVGRLDVDANVASTMRFGVMGVPTLILFVRGEPVERLSGFVPKKRIIERLGPHLGL
ncbi:MAG: thiol reductase thioredoxin [Chloroflexi bacterium RBG_13_68_17]|nr:MAG: thiol reductase thioredoxin [Chloroflexi bacterium RBG_13_68_17]